jgi:hypothetical protein
LNFPLQKSLQNQYLSYSESKSYPKNSIKSCSSRSFQQHHRHIPIPLKFSATIEFYFQWRSHSIFKTFCTLSPNIMEPSLCAPPCKELSKDTKNMIWKHPGLVDLMTTKQNKLPSFIDRLSRARTQK